MTTRSDTCAGLVCRDYWRQLHGAEGVIDRALDERNPYAIAALLAGLLVLANSASQELFAALVIDQIDSVEND